jgi:hypothetical protein
MRPIDALFKVLHRYAWQDEKDYGKTLGEAQDWYDAIPADENSIAEATGMEKLKRKAKAWCINWYGKVAMAILYIIVVRWVEDFMHGRDDDDDENEAD